MYEVILTTRFHRDFKLIVKRGYKIELLHDIVARLAAGEQLSGQNRDHPLRGNWKGYRECHVEPDWLLVYKIERNRLVLVLARTGTHSDLLE